VMRRNRVGQLADMCEGVVVMENVLCNADVSASSVMHVAEK
jgi:hypothetical protein